MSDGFMIVFSVIDRNSFKTIDEWMNYINERVDISTKPNF